MSTAKEVLHHPRAWVYARGVSGSPALHERFDALRQSALREGYEIVGQSSDARQRFAVWHPGRAALLRAVRKGLVDDVFVTRLSQFSRKRSRLRRILVQLQRKGVCVHTTEIDLRYDLYRHGLDNVLTGGCGFHA